MWTQLKALFEARTMLRYLVRAELHKIYRKKLLGFLWILLDPLAMMAVYVFLVAGIFGGGGAQFPVLLFSTLLAWRWFVFALAGSVQALGKHRALALAVRFPLAVLPIEQVVVGLINYLFGLLALVPLLFLYEAQLTWNLLWLPVLVLVQLVFTVGAALLCAVAGVYLRDLENILLFLLRVWFFLSPSLYVARERIPDRWLPWYMLNPFAGLFTSYKDVLVWGTPPSPYLALVAVAGLVLCTLGFRIFQARERQLVKDL